jgi:AMIN domain
MKWMLPVVERRVSIRNRRIRKHVCRRLVLATAVPVCLGALALPQTAKVEQVRLLGGRGTRLEIVANAQITAQAQVLNNPERLVIDIPNAVMGFGLHRLSVHRGGIKDVRVGLFSTNPSITRIVVDWITTTPYRLVTSDKTVIVTLDDARRDSVHLGQVTRDHDHEHNSALAPRPPATVNSPKASSRIERVSLFNNDGVKVEIAANGSITPQIQFLPNPDRLVIDIPEATPGPDSHPLMVGHWGVKNARVGLLSSTPPVTRIVVDIDAVQPYQVSTSDKGMILQLGGSSLLSPTPPRGTQVAALPQQLASTPVAVPSHASALPKVQAQQAVLAASVSPSSKVTVSYRAGLLGIRANQATLAEVLNELHRRTGADIQIPPGAEQDRVVVNLGPADPNQVLSSLLNGTPFNFILMGSASDPRQLGSVLLMRKDRDVPPHVAGPDEAAKGNASISTANVAVANSFQNRNKLGANFSGLLAAGTAPLPAPQPSSSEQAPSQAPSPPSSTPQPSSPQQPSALPTDQELSTPRPVGVDQPPP